MTRASLDKKPQEVAAMFDRVAKRYDLTNTVLSMGLDRRWRRATAKALALRPGERCLDVAAGTAVSSVVLARSGATLVACDFSEEMLRQGRQRGVERAGVELVVGDALHLPFPDRSFDAATISFGLRNVSDTDLALREMRRVVKPGGRLAVCEFSHPTWRPFRATYHFYLTRLLPRIARWCSSNPDAYEYLAASIRAWPNQRELAAKIEAAGWQNVTWRNLTAGVVALHTGFNGITGSGDDDASGDGAGVRAADGEEIPPGPLQL